MKNKRSKKKKPYARRHSGAGTSNAVGGTANDSGTVERAGCLAEPPEVESSAEAAGA